MKHAHMLQCFSDMRLRDSGNTGLPLPTAFPPALAWVCHQPGAEMRGSLSRPRPDLIYLPSLGSAATALGQPLSFVSRSFLSPPPFPTRCSVDKMDDAKIEATRVEDAESSSSAPTGTHVQLPPLLRDLSVEEREKLNLHVKRKIDLRLLPMMLLMYIMNYLDRNNIAAAKLAGLSDDLNLKGNQYQTALSILFVGYLLMQGKHASHWDVAVD